MKAITSIDALRIEVNNAPMSEADARTLAGVTVQQRLSAPTLCELLFVDPGNELRNGQVLKVGTAMRVTVAEQTVALFDGEVTAITCSVGSHRGLQLRVRGYDRLHRLRKRQQIKAHEQVTMADLAASLTQADGLTVQSHASGPSWERVFQHRQSDFELLAEVAHRSALQFFVRDQTLHIATLDGLDDASLPLDLGDGLLDARVEVNGDWACREVAAGGWDMGRATACRGGASTPRVGRGVAAEAPPDLFSGASKRFVAGLAIESDAQADALAQSELDRRGATEVVFEGTAQGDTRLRPGTRVLISGISIPFDGTYTLASVNHVINADRGYLSVLSTAVTPIAPPVTGPTVALGTVTSVQDPQKLGRIQVSLPAYENVETGWMGVLTPGGGANKGLVCLPDVHDQVLVLCAGEDLAHGVILGGVYGDKAPPDAGVEGDSIKRFTIITPGGQRVSMDDQKNVLRLESKDGSYIEASPAGLHLCGVQGVTLEAPGKGIVIRGATIDFTKG